MRAVVAAQLTAARKQDQFEASGSPCSSSSLPSRHPRPRTAGKDGLRPSSRGPRRAFSPSVAAYRNPRDAAALSEIASWGVQVEARLRILEFELLDQRSPTAPPTYGPCAPRPGPATMNGSDPSLGGGFFPRAGPQSPSNQQRQQTEKDAWAEPQQQQQEEQQQQQQQQQQQYQEQLQEQAAASAKLAELLERAEAAQARAELLRKEEETTLLNRFHALEVSVSAGHAALGSRINLVEDMREQLLGQADDLIKLEERLAEHETKSSSVDVVGLSTRLDKCESQMQARKEAPETMAATCSTLPGPASVSPSDKDISLQALEDKVSALAAAVKKHSRGLLGLASDLSMEEAMRNDRLNKLEELTQLLLRSVTGSQAMNAPSPGGQSDGHEPISLDELRATSTETSKKVAEVIPVLEDLRENIKELTYATSRHAARTAERLDDLERQLTQAHPSTTQGPSVPSPRGASTLAAPVPAQRVARNRLRSNTEELAKVVAAAEKGRASREQGSAINVPQPVIEEAPAKQATRTTNRKSSPTRKPILPTPQHSETDAGHGGKDRHSHRHQSHQQQQQQEEHHQSLGDESPYSPSSPSSPLSPTSMAAAAARMAVVAASMTTTVTPPPQELAAS